MCVRVYSLINTNDRFWGWLLYQYHRDFAVQEKGGKDKERVKKRTGKIPKRDLRFIIKVENEKEQKAFAANERTRGLAKQIINFVETMVVRLCTLPFFILFYFFFLF